MAAVVTARTHYEVIVLGAGPAGTGPLVAAAVDGRAPAWLRQGVLWADAGERMGPGSLGQYAISSDTMAKVLLEALQGPHNPLASLAERPVAQQLAARGEGAVPLALAASFMDLLGARLRQMVADVAASDFWPGHRATALHRLRGGGFRVQFANGRQAFGRKVVLAMGGYQDAAQARRAQLVPHVSLSSVPSRKLWLSGALFAHGGLTRLLATLSAAGARSPRVVLLGGSHSAVCAAHLLLNSPLGEQWAPGALQIWCRTPPRPFYASAAAAKADGFVDYGPQDVCPVTARVYRLAGLRMASRDLLRATLGLGGLPIERRVQICLLAEQEPAQLQRALADADAVVACLGYRPHGLAYVDEEAPQRALSPADSFERPRVDAACRLLDAHGEAIEGAFGMGLASGFVPRGPVLGGEPSFRGQTNGIWLYQHELGRMLLNGLVGAGVGVR